MPVFDEGDDSWIGGGGGGTGGGTGGSTQTAIPDLFETATLQVLIGEGRIDGLVDGLKSVYLDGTPILNSDGSKNFKGVALALVAGTNTQAAVKGVGGIESEVSVNVQVTNAASVTRSITSNPSAIRVRIALPALKVIKTDGGTTGHAVEIKIERQNAAYNGGAWEAVSLENAGVIRGGPYSSKFTRSFRVDLPATGTWQVRVTRVSNDDADAYHLSQTWWEAYTEIIDARLRYPNSAVLSLRVNAQQFRSIPRVTCDLKLARIQVPANYDPITRVYAATGTGTTGGAWDGTFKEAWSDNPAWIFFDAATKTRYGAGSFLTASALDKWTLYTIGQWCDTLVDDGKGGTEPRITCNLYMQNQQNAIKALGQLASIFWGVIYYASGLVVPVADANTAPVAVFNSSNVIEGKFTYEGTARSARHTAAVVKFTNPDLGWEPDTAVYEDADGIARFGYNPLDLTALGCTSHGQALRLAKWSILTELLADETITFSSGLEGSTVKPGDVVQVHDQFRAGNVRFGGRVASGATTTVIPLDAPVTFGAGTHYLKIKNASGILETRTVTTAAGTVSSLTVSSAFSVAPAEGAVWLLQAGTEASLWRVLAIRKGEGITYDITALKHDPAKYVLLGLSAGEVLPRDVDQRTSPAPAGLAVTATTRILNDRQVQNLEANWTLDGALSYAAVASKDYGPWVIMAVSGATAILSGIDPGSWRVRVVGSWPAGNSPFAEATAVVTAPATQPPWVADAAAAAAAAASAASNAQTAANTANTALANIASDSLLTPDEKPRVIQDRDVIIAEQAGIDAQATAYSITTEKTAYDTAVSALTTYLATLTSPVLWSDIAGNTTIVGATFRTKFADVYTTRQALLNKIYNAAKALADAAAAAAGTAATAAAYADALARSSHNLIKNGNSEDANPTGYEAAGVITDPFAYAGSKFRYVTTWTYITDEIPCAPGDQFCYQSMAYSSGGGRATIGMRFKNAAGTPLQYNESAQSTPVSPWTPISTNGTAPAGAVSLAFYVGPTGGTAAGFDCIFACRKISAGMLEADLAIVGVVRSPNYVAGSYGNAPQGFKLSGFAYTTTFTDGSTSSNCFVEIGGDGNFGGRKVATVNDRVFQPFNRLSNGKFAYSAAPWAISGTYTAWNATSKTAGTGSLLTSISGASDETSTITQSFAMPVAPGTVTLQLATGFSVVVSSGSGTATNEVKAYILNTTTGTETLVGTWSYSATANTTLAWTDRSVDISSLVAAGGDFAIRITDRVTRTGLFATVNGYIDEVSIIA